MVDYTKLSDQELDDLVLKKINQGQSSPSVAKKSYREMSDEELDFELSKKISGSQKPIDETKEAELGFINRAKYSIEPLQSNREAFLRQEFGKENVISKDGELFVKQGGSFLPVNKEGVSTADVAEFAGATPEILGTGVGFISGGLTPASIAGGIAGGVAGSAIRQGLSAASGVPQVASVKERSIETGLSGLFGAAGSGVVKAAPVVGKGAIKAVDKATDIIPFMKGLKTGASNVMDTIKKNWSEGIAKDAPRYFTIADKYGIEKELLPEAVEFGKESAVSRSARAIAEGPYGEQRLKNFFKAHDQVADAIDRSGYMISKVKFRDEIDAGEFLTNSIDNIRKNLQENGEATYSVISQNFPDMELSKPAKANITRKLNEISEFARGRIDFGIGTQKKEAANLLNAVNTLKRSEKSIADTITALKNIGEEAFKDDKFGVREAIDKKRLKDLYFTYRKNLVKSIEDNYGDYGKDIAESLKQNNKSWSDYLKKREVLSNVLDRENISPERIYKQLVTSGDSKKLDALKDLLPEQDFQAIKRSFLESKIAKNAEDRVLYGTTFKNIDKNKQILNRYFSPEELTPVGELVDLGGRMGDPVLSSSGTGASNQFSKFFDKLSEGIQGETSLEYAKTRARKNTKEAAKKAAKEARRKSGKMGFFESMNEGKTGGLSNLFRDDFQREKSREDKEKK